MWVNNTGAHPVLSQDSICSAHPGTEYRVFTSNSTGHHKIGSAQPVDLFAHCVAAMTPITF